MRVVVDTNVLVSFALFPNGAISEAIEKAFSLATVLYSEQTLDELVRVLDRPKLLRYSTPEDRLDFIEHFIAECERVPVTYRTDACRDPKDNQFLELAVSGMADVIITGDQDLLELHPFEGVAILTPRQFFEHAL